MNIIHMRANHVANPLGFDLGTPNLSWVVEDTKAKRQMAARVLIAQDEAFQMPVYDSGRRADISSLSFAPDFSPKPYTRYYWKVKVWGDNGEEAESAPAFFETAKQNDPWRAKWITPCFENDIHPLIRKEFTLPAEAVSARAYICGLGVYELELNGRRAGEEFLAPGFHAYRHWLQYQTYDITPLLQKGANAVGVMLGNGWYRGRLGFDGGHTDIFGGRFALVCEIRAVLKDGSVFTVLSDGSWKCKAGPVLASGIYDGETYDANRETENWSCPGLDEHDWEGVGEADLGYNLLTARHSLPVVVKERRKPAEIIRTPAGETVLDFGQNMTGWVEFDCCVPKGVKLRYQCGEILQGGNFYNENLRTAKEEFIYIADGKKRHVRPHFTYYGFRYVKLTGFEKAEAADFTACVLYSDLEQTGTVETSDPELNRLFLNVIWGQRGNFLDVPTDCPQRDERMGWTGDAQIFAGTACFNMYTPAFYEKYMRDVAEEQRVCHGSVPHFVPSIAEGLPEDADGFIRGAGSCAWGDVATVLPWTLYLFYGDQVLLAKQYPSMRAWVGFIKEQDEKNGGKRLWQTGEHFADWLALDGPDPDSCYGGTDPYYIASAYYLYSTCLTAKAAKALGKTADAREYEKLADEIRKAVLNEYFTPDGDCKLDTQTSLVVALYMHIVPEEQRAKTCERLKSMIRANGMHLTTGFVGTPYLCRVLSGCGASDYAYTLLLNTDYPSWLYEVRLGATTVWERWNSVLPDGSISGTGMNSLNHYSYGSIAEWMYRCMCGVNPAEEAPGFKKARIVPHPDPRLQYASAVFQSPSGRYESGWRFAQDGTVTYKITVPFDAQADVALPCAEAADVICNGAPLSQAGVPYQADGGSLRMVLGSGEWEFACVKMAG